MKPTIYDIAKKAGVSAATVSNVINERGRVGDKTRKKVLAIMDELQYRPNTAASVLKGKAAFTIGFFVPDMLNPVYMEYVKHAEERAQERGFSIMMCSTENDPVKERLQADVLRQKNVDGFIITSKFQNEELLREIEREQYPSVCIAHERPDFQFDSVSGNDWEAGIMAADYLFSLGHTNIAMIAEKDSVSSYGRIEGFKERFRKKEMKQPLIRYAEASIDQAKAMALNLLKQDDRPTAVFGGNDVLAVGIMQAARTLGLSIPEDISVIGLDDTFLCQIVSPQLTAIAMPVKKISYRAVDLLIEQIEKGGTLKSTDLFPPVVIERDSARKL
ncbi:hypothetical protein BTO30_00300 [Domibacillus antri]|uniref:HTH lacI-type domain-containing protein n=2 Tax=Domibacillus antri TaxID=1714264 RepID=A0A1Q8QA87_9BACI|nr:hypothetical protein BTO30_00300 [Domibacillus antri]